MRIQLLGIFVLLSVPLFAQSDRGTITGTIADPAGAIVPGAPVSARNVETGATYEAASSATGNYTLAQLPAGTYELTVAVAGFKRFQRERIVVQVAQTLRVDVALEVGSANESVTVTDQVTLLKTESGELSHTVSGERLNELPILGIGGGNSSSQGIRFFLSQTQLIPGSNFSTGINGVRINGAPNNTMRVQIEGMDATNALIPFSSASLQPSVDAIQETSIQTSNYSAEFGQVGGGLFNVTMRSGSNAWHGGAFDYLANDALNAATPFVNQKPEIKRNNYGLSLGGPVKIPRLYNGHDKTFFFANFEQYREFFQTNDHAITVPTAAYRTGDFSSVIPANARTLGTDPMGRAIREGTIYDPASDHLVNGSLIRDPFPGNMIPAARFDPVALAIQKLIPAPSSASLTQNLLPSFPNDRVTSNYSLKIDHQISSRAKLSGYFGSNKTASQFSQQLNGSEGLPAPITATRGTFTQSWTYRVNFDYTLTPSMLFHLGAGFAYYSFNDNAPTLTYDSLSSLGLKGATVRGDAGGRFPQITGLCQVGLSPVCTGSGGTANMGPGPQSKSNMVTPTTQATLTWVKDNHTFKFGAEVRPQGFVGHYLTGTNGVYNFAADETALPYLQSSVVGGGRIGFPYASFLLGAVNNGTINLPSDVRIGKQQWALYAQDTWKVTRTLTLDYGLRWDYGTYPREQYGRLPSLDPNLANPTAGGHPGAAIFEATCNCNLAENYKLAFGPRVGLAYQITPKTVIRTGIGISYNTTPVASAASARADNPFFGSGFGLEAMNLRTGIPSQFVQPWPIFSSGLYPFPSNPGALTGVPNVVDQNSGRPARQIMWSLGVQREVFGNLVVEASYVGNRGAWWPSTTLVNYNALTPQALAARGLDINSAADRAILRAPIGSASAGRFRNQLPYSGFPTTQTVAQSLRPFPQFASALTPVGAPLGRTWYDSLQVKATKRFSRGLDFTYAFTFAKELQMGTDGPPIGGSNVNDIFNRDQNKYLSPFSRPFVHVLALNYRLPVLHINPVLSWVARDWTLGTVLQYASGTPIHAPTSNNRLNTLLFRGTSSSGGTYFNRVPGQPLFLKDLNCHCIDPYKDLVLNKDAWADAADGTFGTSAAYYDDYRFQRRPSEALSVARNFPIKERVNIMIRLEFTNVFNRTEMSDPSISNAAQATTNSGGKLTGGFGFINPATVFAQPRQGTLIARFSF